VVVVEGDIAVVDALLVLVDHGDLCELPLDRLAEGELDAGGRAVERLVVRGVGGDEGGVRFGDCGAPVAAAGDERGEHGKREGDRDAAARERARARRGCRSLPNSSHTHSFHDTPGVHTSVLHRYYERLLTKR